VVKEEKMARYRGPRLKIIRRLGTPLPGLKRTDPDLRRPYPPGQHGPTRRKKLTDYALRLMEKQKLRFHYGVSEKQLRKYVAKAFQSKGNSGLNLLVSLERRLDNAVFRAGFAPTIPAARQMVRHGHVTVNGRKVNIPSYQLRAGEVIAPRDNSKFKERMIEARQDPNNLSLPQYFEVQDEAKGELKFNMLPVRDDVPVLVNEQLIVEYYSGK
jgi:small subunit ribosomal protein S4